MSLLASASKAAVKPFEDAEAFEVVDGLDEALEDALGLKGLETPPPMTLTLVGAAE